MTSIPQSSPVDNNELVGGAASRAQVLRLLATGTVEILGRLPRSSNGTFLARVAEAPEAEAPGLLAVYKPVAGERRLFDFPPGLDRREVAAYELSEWLGWRIVPETVPRKDAPLGPGSLQRFLDADFAEHYFTLVADPRQRDRLRTIAVFDIVANNADRKSGHCILAEGTVWAIDNGLCFHAAPKLRTVVWDFGGEPVPEALLEGLERLARNIPACLEELLDEAERRALQRRARRLLARGRLPELDPLEARVPWPPV
jgi:uncharacterized repeat protein (TIGR03843 family)